MLGQTSLSNNKNTKVTLNTPVTFTELENWNTFTLSLMSHTRKTYTKFITTSNQAKMASATHEENVDLNVQDFTAMAEALLKDFSSLQIDASDIISILETVPRGQSKKKERSLG